MQPQQVAAESELWRYLRVFRRWLWILIALPLIAGIAAYLVSTQVLKPSYCASALVKVGSTSTENLLLNVPASSDTDRARTMATAVATLQSTPVAQAVANAFPVYHGNPALVPAVSASNNGTTDFISAQICTAKPRLAAQLATAYAHFFVDQQKTRQAGEVQAAEAGLQQQLAGIQKQLDTLNAQVNNAAPADRATFEAAIAPARQALITQQTTLKQRLDALQVESGLQTGGVQLYSNASVPTTSSSPRKYFNTGLAAMGGLLLAIGIVLLMEILDDSVRNARDVVALVPEVSVLGAVPTVPGWGGRLHQKETRLVSLSDPMSPAAEGYRSLRTAISVLRSQHGVRSFLVTGPTAREGKTATAANLAVAMAKAGDSVLLVGADLRGPRLHEFFGLSNSQGLSTLLTGAAAPASVVQPVDGVRGLSVITSGPVPADPSDLLSTARGTQLLNSLKDYADVVIIDAPSVLGVNDAGALSRSVQSVLLVVRVGHTSKRKLVEAVGAMERIDAPFLRLVVNQADGVPRAPVNVPSTNLNGKATVAVTEPVEA